MSRAALFVGDCSRDTTFVVDHLPEPDEKVHADTFVEGPGGVVANAAVAAARAGAQVRLLVRTGDDPAGAEIVAALRDAGVAVDAEPAAGPTCRVVTVLEGDGEKRLLLAEGVSMYPSAEAIAALDLGGVGWVHTAAYGDAAPALAARCRATGIPWSVDVEPATLAAGEARIGPVLDGAAVIFCNARAIAALGREGAARLFAHGVGAIVLTQGPLGATLLRPDGSRERTPAPPAPPVRDTTGAGDCLAGWIVAARLRGASLEAALADAVVAATMSCAGLGAQTSYPTRAAVEAFPRRA